MIKLDATSVVVNVNGVPTDIHTYKAFEDAANRFRDIITECTKEYETPYTEEDMENCVDNGVWDDDNGFEVYLMTSECEGEEDEDEEEETHKCTECGHEFDPKDLLNWGDRKVCFDCYDALDDEKADMEELNW